MKHTRFWRFALLAILLALCVAGYNGYLWWTAEYASDAGLPRSRMTLSLAAVGGIIVSRRRCIYMICCTTSEVNIFLNVHSILYYMTRIYGISMSQIR